MRNFSRDLLQSFATFLEIGSDCVTWSAEVAADLAVPKASELLNILDHLDHLG